MLRNYITIALRTLLRNRAYASINVVGLALGIACGLLIFTLVTYHFSFDTFHADASRTYRIYTEFKRDGGSMKTPGAPNPLGKAVRNDFTFAEKVARVNLHDNQLISIVSGKEVKKFREQEGVAFAEPAFFDIFNFPLVQGSHKTALTEPNTAIVTEKIARKCFGNANPVGKTIRLDNKTDFRITGILRDLPKNTDRRTEIYLSYPTLTSHFEWMKQDMEEWGDVSSDDNVFVLLKPAVSVATVEKALAGMVKKYRPGRDAQTTRYHLQPLGDVHFNPELNGFVEKKNLWALALIGVFLIVTACVNFVNLATAQALNRSKEVGVRKVLGSLPAQLFWQFIAETALITAVAVLLAYGLAHLALPYLNQLFETQMGINPFADWSLLAFTAILTVLVVFLSGSYPGLILAGFEPVLALKGKMTQRNVGGFPVRRMLVVAQFAIAQMLIIGTIVIASQMRFSKQSDLGFNKDAIVMLPVPTADKVKMNTLKTRLAQLAGVEKVSLCYQAPASNNYSESSLKFDTRPESEQFSINRKAADADYLATFNLKLVAGRNIFPSDTVREFLLNETAVRMLNVKNPQEIIGKYMEINGRKAPVVGVVRDFHNLSFHEKVQPVCIMSSTDNYDNCAVKISLGNVKPTLAGLEKIWNEAYPEYVYESQFLDERIAGFYEMEAIMLNLIQAFAGIAILIGCLGLYGLVSFMAVQKTKEIGIRKVLGASIGSLLWLFGREFSRLIVIAFIIAAPVAWYVMNGWLQDFQYRIEIGAGIFVLAIASTFVVAVLTVGYRSVRAALANPVKSLRSE